MGMEEAELLKTGGPFLIAVVLIFKMYFDGKLAPNHTQYDRDMKRIETSVSKIEGRQLKSFEAFSLTVQRFTSCVEKLSGKLDLHAKTLEIINGNLETISERLTHLERRG